MLERGGTERFSLHDKLADFASGFVVNEDFHADLKSLPLVTDRRNGKDSINQLSFVIQLFRA